MKSLYDAINQFWTETVSSPLPLSACALYHFLCYKANRQRWQMPVKCSTEMLAYCLQVSCPTVRTARKKLAAHGFISYVQGKRKSSHAEYTILDKQGESHDLTRDVQQGTAQNFPQKLSQDFPQDFRQDFPQCFPQNFPINIKKKEEERIKNTSPNNARVEKSEDKISLSELEERLAADDEWLQSVTAFIATCGLGTLETTQTRDYLHRFFQYLSASGQNEREEKDTRRYFSNWLKVHIQKQNNHANKHNSGTSNSARINAADRRRPLDFSTAQTKDYHSSF